MTLLCPGKGAGRSRGSDAHDDTKSPGCGALTRATTLLPALLWLAGCQPPPAPTPAQQTSAPANPTQPPAEQRIDALLRHGAEFRRLRLDCLALLQEDDTPAHTDWAVMEKHSGPCPGDPATSPVAERLRLAKHSDRVWRYDPVNGEYLPYPPPASR